MQNNNRKQSERQSLRCKKELVEAHCCMQDKHRKAAIRYVCLQLGCRKNRACCKYCLIDAHEAHDILQIKDLDHQLKLQKHSLVDLLCGKLNNLELGSNQQLSRLIKTSLKSFRNSVNQAINNLEQNIFSQLSHFKMKMIRTDADFTLHYERFSSRLIEKDNKLNIVQKARLIVDLRHEISQFSNKAYLIQDKINHKIEYLLNQVQRKINLKDKIIIKQIEEVSNISSNGNFRRNSNSPFSKQLTPIRQGRCRSSVSKQISNRSLVQTSHFKKNKLDQSCLKKRRSTNL